MRENPVSAVIPEKGGLVGESEIVDEDYRQGRAANRKKRGSAENKVHGRRKLKPQ